MMRRTLALLLGLLLLFTAPAIAQTTISRAQPAVPTTLQNAATANGNGTAGVVSGYASVLLRVTCTTCSGGTTVNFDLSADGGTTWNQNVLAVPTTATTLSGSTTATGDFWLPASNYNRVRARISAYSAGTVTVVAYPSFLPIPTFPPSAAAGGTSSNFASAFPSAGTAAGFSDGTNMQGARVFDADTGGGTQYVQGVNLRLSASGGSVEFGTATNPVRTDPTGTTAQPVTFSGTPAFNLSQVAGTTAATGAGNATAGSPRVVIATDQAALAGLAVGATGSGVPANSSYQGVNVGGNLRGQTGVTTGSTFAADTNVTHIAGTAVTYVADPTTDCDTGAGTQTCNLVGFAMPASGGAVAGGTSTVPLYTFAQGAATATTTNSVLGCAILSAASTNSTNCKGSAGNFYGYEIFNTTTTTYYLRLYDAAAAPTCSSATGFIRSIPIPPAGAAGQVGGAVIDYSAPKGFTNGFGYCITGGSSSTDNTNAATGIFGELRYK